MRIERLPKPWIDECCAWLKDWTKSSSFLEQDIPAVPGIELPDKACAFALDERLRKLAQMRECWGELTGRLALLIRLHRLWRDMRFVSFSHYCNDRLFSSARAIEQRAFLERRFFQLPGLREALRAGRINYTKALFLAGTSSAESIAERIEWAAGHTIKEMRVAREDAKDEELREALKDERQAVLQSDVDFRVPERTADLLCDAVFAAKAVWHAAGMGHLSTSKALVWLALHFMEVWEGKTGAPRGKRKEILGRHRGLCSVPTCTLPAEETHHLKFRSQGGGDEKENLTGPCRAHHGAVHEGYVKILGRAGARLVFELGMRDGVPLEVYEREE